MASNYSGSKPIKGDAPAQSHAFLRKMLPKWFHPYARGLRKRILRERYRQQQPFNHIYAFTQTSLARQDSILEKARMLVDDGIAGDFVECGVLDGGTAALMAYAAREDDRRIHLFDAWKGLPDTTEADGAGSAVWVGDVVGSPKRVMTVLKKVGARMDSIVFHKGWFEDTLPEAEIDRIAFLHVDCDFYEPTLLVLRTLVPKMVSGGWVQIDDYTSFEGCRVAVDEFLAEQPRFTLQVEDKPGGAIFFQIP